MARHKKIQAIDLTSAVDDLLEDYGDEVYDALGKAIEETAQEAVRSLRSVRKFNPERNPTGKYSAGWTAENVTRARTKQVTVVYNEDLPQYAHLLEFGHVTRNGGRSGEYEHIAPVNKEVKAQIAERVRRALS